MTVACMSLVMLDFSFSFDWSNVCSTTPILMSIWTVSCFSFVKLCLIFTKGAAEWKWHGIKMFIWSTSILQSCMTFSSLCFKPKIGLKHSQQLTDIHTVLLWHFKHLRFLGWEMMQHLMYWGWTPFLSRGRIAKRVFQGWLQYFFRD